MSESAGQPFIHIVQNASLGGQFESGPYDLDPGQGMDGAFARVQADLMSRRVPFKILEAMQAPGAADSAIIAVRVYEEPPSEGTKGDARGGLLITYPDIMQFNRSVRAPVYDRRPDGTLQSVDPDNPYDALTVHQVANSVDRIRATAQELGVTLTPDAVDVIDDKQDLSLVS